jgi:hypothetical protein
MFIENVNILEMLFPAVTQLVEGLSLEILLTLMVSKSVIGFADTRRPAISIIGQHLILFLKMIIRNKESSFCRLE